AVFDAAPDRAHAIAAARALVAQRAPAALRSFPTPQPRYVIAPAPAATIEGLKPYLSGDRQPTLYGALRIRRDAEAPAIEYWSINLSHKEPSAIAAGAMALEMRREALARQGLPPQSADALDALAPATTEFNPRAAGARAVTWRERAPFYASLMLAFVLW